MALIPEITCHRCGAKYSGLKLKCPTCGAPRKTESNRAPKSTRAATRGTPEAARSAIDGRWQMIFAGIMAAAVLVAVIVLAVSGGRGSSGTSSSSGSSSSPSSSTSTAVTITDTYLPTPSPSPEPTPDISDQPRITSMELIFLNSTVSDITLTNEGEIKVQFEARTYPSYEDSKFTWSSDNEKILQVSDNGLVTVVGADPSGTVHATITVECEGLTASCIIYVPYYQAAYLSNNAYTN